MNLNKNKITTTTAAADAAKTNRIAIKTQN